MASARAKRRDVLKALSILLMAGGAGTLAWNTTPLPTLMADQRTGTGERRRVRLDDGTQLQLNTATAVDIRYSGNLREVRLLQGEIQIETARDAQARPFVVHTAEGSIRALGTRFVVRCEADLTQVSVQEHDPAVAALRISGAFHLASTDTILENLTSTLPVRIRRFSRFWTSVEPV